MPDDLTELVPFELPWETVPLPPRDNAPRIAISGRYLDEVQTRVAYDPPQRVTALLSRPAKTFRAIAQGKTVILNMPELTALQLYFDGILPVDRSVPVTLEVEGKALGSFVVTSLRTPDHQRWDHHILLELQAVPATRSGDEVAP
jgi:hypothetical protein